MIRVVAPSRLHFGLFVVPGESGQPKTWPDSEGQPTVRARHYGGAGLMIEKPGIALSVEPAAAWSTKGPCAERAIGVAKLACQGWGVQQPFAIHVERCSPEHVGLGTGTQLSLAVARAIALATDRAHVSVADLAKHVGRGRRSAIGVHGFVQGGFIVDGGKRDADAISPLIARVPFPEEWAVLLVIPRDLQGDHGQRETEAFQLLARCQPDLAPTDSLCRLVLLGMLPALIERDLEGFGAALHEYNRRAGELFKPWQAGVYANPNLAKLIQLLRDASAKCVGHSSWGPTVFAIASPAEAIDLGNLLTRQHGFESNEVLVTRASNMGAVGR